MKREEKNQLTRNKIIHGALVQFSSPDYQPVASYAFGAKEEKKIKYLCKVCP